jgi:CubicO group peptidase (beta-lactamase class C family)
VTADLAHWQHRLDELSTEHNVPGASLAILDGGELTEVASGVINSGTAVETTTDSVFQIGSITKVWTTTLLMQQADQGKLNLDAPLTDVLPELSLASPCATGQITTRHLLSHTSGIDGDVFDDFGRGDDCVARYVAACSRLFLTQPVGATMSYCNAGFVIAGRIIERLTGASWDASLRRSLIQPLGLKRTVTLPEEAIRFRAAYGHIDADGEQRLAPAWALPGGAGPAGGIIASAGDVIAFAQLHLRGGLALDGTRLVSASSVAAMQRPQVEVPSYPHGERHVGLGWQLSSWDGEPVIGHNGGTIGQYSFLHVLPDRDAAVCLLTNGGHHERLCQDLAAEIFPALWQVTPPRRPEPAATAADVDPARYVGRYEREGIRLDVSPAGPGDPGLTLTVTHTGHLAELLEYQVETVQLLPAAPDVFVGRSAEADPWEVFTFFQLDGQGSYVHAGGRATPRRDS